MNLAISLSQLCTKLRIRLSPGRGNIFFWSAGHLFASAWNWGFTAIYNLIDCLEHLRTSFNLLISLMIEKMQTYANICMYLYVRFELLNYCWSKQLVAGRTHREAPDLFLPLRQQVGHLPEMFGEPGSVIKEQLKNERKRMENHEQKNKKNLEDLENSSSFSPDLLLFFFLGSLVVQGNECERAERQKDMFKVECYHGPSAWIVYSCIKTYQNGAVTTVYI